MNENELQHEEVLELCIEETRLSPSNPLIDKWLEGWEFELRLMQGGYYERN